MTKKGCSRRAVADLPPPPSLFLDAERSTPAMRSSLKMLQASLLCPLCNQVFASPASLPCSHTFCLSCADDYACNAWTCPVLSCNMPFMVRGGRSGSYLKVNPQIQTVVESFHTICATLNNAPKEWWEAKEEKEDDEDEELVDLQSISPQARSSHDDDDTPCATEDSEQTKAFARPTGLTSPPQWMNPISEEKESPMGCDLPSQSPNVSPISLIQSQQDDTPNKVSHLAGQKRKASPLEES